MRWTRRISGIALMLVLALAACEGDDAPADDRAVEPIGGTLRLAMAGDVQAALDPAREYYTVSWELLRCCLTRTVMGYEGVPADEGGDDVQPDLAASMPVVSADGLTYTFRLRRGIRYAPPFDDVEVTAPDVIRAFERAADPDVLAPYASYFHAIAGFAERAAGETRSIEGLSAPDDHTLVVRLVEPVGYFLDVMALPATSPVPPLGDAALGAAQGHDQDYGRFLVSTGPYMAEGAGELEHGDRSPAPGYRPGRSLVLVRNPSWSAADDDLRVASADRIEVTMNAGGELTLQVEAGEIDLVLDEPPPPDVLARSAHDEALARRVHAEPQDATNMLTMNLAAPPFDDVHVRRAVSFAIDRAGLQQLAGGPITGSVAHHVIPDTLLGGELAGYEPYPSAGDAGDLDAARAEMASSTYDDDGDGRCDDPACDGVLVLTPDAAPTPAQAAAVRSMLEPLGISLDVRKLEITTFFARCADPSTHAAACFGLGWAKDVADGYIFGPPLFHSSSIAPGCCNTTLTGASPEQLRGFGYDVVDVPSADAQLERCGPLTGDERRRCWAEADRYLMEEVVAVVPYATPNHVALTSERVAAYSYCAFTGAAALDRIAVSA
jgi:peptide/nickel transport system substrate-binding protein